MKRLLFAIFLLLPFIVKAQLTDIDGKTPAQLSAITDDETESDADYWNTHAYLYIQSINNALKNRSYNDQDYASFSAAVTAATTDTALLSVSSRWNLTSSTTVSGQTALQINPNGRLNNPTGSILTINVPIVAGPYQIFEGNIDSVRIGRQTFEIYPEWFGAAGDNSTEDRNAFQAAINSVDGSFDGAQRILLSRWYKISDSLSVNNKTIIIEGNSAGTYRIGYPNNYASTLIDAGSLSSSKNLFNIRGDGASGTHTVILRNLRIDGHDATGTGALIYAYGLRALVLDKVFLHQSALNGIKLDGSKGVVNQLFITDSFIRQGTGDFLYTGNGIVDSSGVNDFHVFRSEVSLFERNVYHKDTFGDPTALGPWRWEQFFVTGAGEESCRLEDVGDIEFSKCSFENGAQTNEDAATFHMLRGNGFISDSYFSENTQADTGIVFLDSCSVVQIANSTLNNGAGDCVIRIGGGNRISITNNNITSGGGSGIILTAEDDGSDPDRIRIVGNSIASAGIGIQTTGLTGTIANSVIMGNTYGTDSVGDLATEADFDSTCLILNPIREAANSDYAVPYLHDRLVVNSEVGIGIEAADGIELKLGSNVPQLVFYDEDGTANNKQWVEFANGGEMRFEKVNDAFTASGRWLTVSATNTTIDSISLPNGGIKIGSVNSQGAGTLNVENGIYDDGSINTDYVFEQAYQDTAWTIGQVEAFYKEHKHLPWITGREEWDQKKPSLGKLVNQLWETIENQQLQMTELHKRLNELEAK